MTIQSQGLATVLRMIAGWEALDAEAVAACFADDGVWHNMPYAPIAGRLAIMRAVEAFIGEFVDVRFELRCVGETAAGIVMTERIDIFQRSDGSQLRFPVMGVFEIEDGSIREWRDYFDSALMIPT